jgi:hypothetical protein
MITSTVAACWHSHSSSEITRSRQTLLLNTEWRQTLKDQDKVVLHYIPQEEQLIFEEGEGSAGRQGLQEVGVADEGEDWGEQGRHQGEGGNYKSGA